MDRVDSKDEILSGSVSYRGITYESDDKLMARVFNLPARRRPNVKSAYNEHMSKAERQRLELEKAERIFTRAYYERRATETFKVGDSSSSHFSVSTDEPGAREPGELPHIGQYSPQSGLSNGNSAPFTLSPISSQLGDINHLPEPSVTADSGDRLHSRIARRERERERERREPIYATYEDGGLLGNLYGKQGDGPGHRGRTIIGGVALGAIDAETITGARSRYRERPAKSTVSKGPVYDDFTTLGAAIDTVRAINKLRERPGRMMNGVVSTSPPPLPRTNNDSGVGGMGLGDDLQRYGLPPLPATLVAGIDPMIAQEISDRIYNEKRASYNENSARDRYQSSPQSQQNRSHPLSYHEAAQPFVPVDFGSLSAGFGQLANQQWKSFYYLKR
jgi:hypothetical protein